MKTLREYIPETTGLNDILKCNRCRNVHQMGERLIKPLKWHSDIVCPRCECKVTVMPTPREVERFKCEATKVDSKIIYRRNRD